MGKPNKEEEIREKCSIDDKGHLVMCTPLEITAQEIPNGEKKYKKGIYVVEITITDEDGSVLDSGVFGAMYKHKKKEDPTLLQYCPWCGFRIIDVFDRMKENMYGEKASGKNA